MDENQVAQRIVKLVTPNQVFELGKQAAKREGHPKVTGIHQLSESGGFRIDLETKKIIRTELEIEAEIKRFIVVFEVESIDVEEMEPPKIVMAGPQAVPVPKGDN